MVLFWAVLGKHRKLSGYFFRCADGETPSKRL